MIARYYVTITYFIVSWITRVVNPKHNPTQTRHELFETNQVSQDNTYKVSGKEKASLET